MSGKRNRNAETDTKKPELCADDASGFATGIYFCRMTAGDYSNTIKIVLVK
jgi:hypothetical protein